VGRFDLGTEARGFAQDLTTILNGTVCHGVPIAAVRAARGDLFHVGYNLRSDEFIRVGAIPLTVDARPPSGYLGLMYTLAADHEGRYLMVLSSVMTYGLNTDTDHPLFHYDYERDKADGYPDAHLQVGVDPPGWDALCSSRSLDKSFGALHLPMGHKRFRPTIEDLIRFLIVERLADHREGWEAVLADSQQQFEEKQLRAAIRRNPDVARQALDALDTG